LQHARDEINSLAQSSKQITAGHLHLGEGHPCNFCRSLLFDSTAVQSEHQHCLAHVELLLQLASTIGALLHWLHSLMSNGLANDPVLKSLTGFIHFPHQHQHHHQCNLCCCAVVQTWYYSAAAPTSTEPINKIALLNGVNNDTNHHLRNRDGAPQSQWWHNCEQQGY
jgi:hypothetical protein